MDLGEYLIKVSEIIDWDKESIFDKLVKTYPKAKSNLNGIKLKIHDTNKLLSYIMDNMPDTKNNQNLFDKIEYTPDGYKIYNKDIFITDVMYQFEDVEKIPDHITKLFPELELKEWEAILRFIVLILTDIENENIVFKEE